jgi:hypothetical protein
VFIQSSLLNDAVYKNFGVFNQMATGENRVESERREREREQQISRVRDGVLGGYRNGVG